MPASDPAATLQDHPILADGNSRVHSHRVARQFLRETVIPRLLNDVYIRILIADHV